MAHSLEKYIRDIPDFPTTGVVFKDITTLMEHPTAFKEAADALYENVKQYDIQKVVGVESRGFIFGALLAERLNAGFIPARKPGKLPYKTIRQEYQLEYGTDCLEIHEGAIKPGEHVLLHDDLLATGGTALAACKLIEKLGGKVIKVSFLIELGFLKGAERLSDYPTSAVITY